jgi:hypothetical protein
MSDKTPRGTGEVFSTLIFAGVALLYASEVLINKGTW